MVTGGYVPSRDQMAVIVGATRELYRVTRRWQAHSRLPGYPIERGNAAALESLFNLERALNPRCFAWEHPTRQSLRIDCWPSAVAEGLAWARNLLDLILERNQLQTLAAAAHLNVWMVEHRSVPAIISIELDELKALRIINRLLPKPENLPEVQSVARPGASADAEPGRPSEPLAGEEEATAPVILFGRQGKPRVLGTFKNRLTPAQYHVIKALLDAGNKGLKKAALGKVCGDAINVLKRLAQSDPDWGAVIELAGKKGRGYRLGAPEPDASAGQRKEAAAAPDARAVASDAH